jgi:hypothetical protein
MQFEPGYLKLPNDRKLLAEGFVRFLNECFKTDPEATKALFAHRVPVNEAMADHPTVQVAAGDPPTMSILGLLNGFVGVIPSILTQLGTSAGSMTTMSLTSCLGSVFTRRRSLMSTFIPFPSDRVPGGDPPIVYPTDQDQTPLPIRLVLGSVMPDAKWVFQLDESSFRETNGKDPPIVDAIKSVFPWGFVPEQKAKYVIFRFENEDGSYWGGEDIDLRAKFEEFFKWWAKSDESTSFRSSWYRPAWLTFRAWQLLRGQVSRRSWDDVAPSELTIEILQTRKNYFDEGMYQEHGYPARLILTLE